MRTYMRKTFCVTIFIVGLLFAFCVKIRAVDYSVGDKVKYEDDEYYVFDVSDDYVSLLKNDVLYAKDIKNIDEVQEYVGKEEMMSSPFSNNYDDSEVKKIIDVWVSKFNEDDLARDKYGYFARTPFISDMLNIGVEKKRTQIAEDYYENQYITLNAPFFIRNSASYWIFNDIEELQEQGYYGSYSDMFSIASLNDFNAIRPILNVKKDKVKILFSSSINNSYSINDKLEYSVGDVINYNGINFYVLRDSKKNDSTVTLIKAEPLTIDEVNKYGSGHVNEYCVGGSTELGLGKAVSVGKYGGMAYYQSNLCCSISGGGAVDECKNDYNQSEIKFVVDAWANDNINANDLGTDSDGKSIRLLNDVDLTKYLNYASSGKEITDGGEYLKYTDYTPNFNLFDCWTMSALQDDSMHVLFRGANGYFYTQPVYINEGTVCPVVTLKKTHVESVKVPDTNKKNNLFLSIVAIFMIIIALGLTIFKVVKSKKMKGNNKL